MSINNKADEILRLLKERYVTAKEDEKYLKYAGVPEDSRKHTTWRYDLMHKKLMEAMNDFGSNIDLAEIDEILEYLEMDDFIASEVINDERMYRIKFKGIQFLTEGGFTEKEKYSRDVRKKTRIDAKHASAAFWISIISILTALIALFKEPLFALLNISH